MIGDNIKNFRLKNKMTQEALSERLSVTRQAISNWECGRVEPDIATLHRLAAVFHISVDTLIYGCQRFVSLVLPELTDADKQAFEEILAETRSHFAEKPRLRQMIAVRTAHGSTYCQDAPWEDEFWTPGDFRCEESIIAALENAKDTHVQYLAVMWNSGVDLPQPAPMSWFLAQRLLEVDFRNLNTLVLLWGGMEGHYAVKPMHIIAPPNIVKRFTQDTVVAHS